MKARYEHISVFSLSGGVTALRGDVAPLVATETLGVRLTSSIRDAIGPVARSLAARDRFFRGALPTRPDEIEANTVERVAAIERKHARTFLVCCHRGEITLPITKVLAEYDTSDGVLQVVEVDRGVGSEIRASHAQANAVVVATTCGQLEGSADKVCEGVRFDAGSIEIIPFYLSAGNATVTISRAVEAQRLETLRQVLPEALGDAELGPIAGLYLDAMHAHDDLVGFFLAWAATERFVHHVFKRRSLVADPEPGRPRVPLNARAAKVADAIIPDHDRGRVLECFKSLKKERDNIFHRGGRATAGFPTADACRLFSELLRQHHRAREDANAPENAT